MKSFRSIIETITIPISIGDEILTGHWKNKRTKVFSIDYDSRGMPLINGKKILNFRLTAKQ